MTSATSSALKRAGDRAVGLVGGDEDLVDVVEAERPEVDEDAMLVGHVQGDPLDPGAGVEHRGAHGVERLLDREAAVAGEGLEQDAADLGVRGVPVEVAAGVVDRREPVGLEHRGQDAVGGVGQRRVAVAEEPGERRARRLEQEQVVEARLDVQAAAAAPDACWSASRCAWPAKAWGCSTPSTRIRSSGCSTSRAVARSTWA